MLHYNTAIEYTQLKFSTSKEVMGFIQQAHDKQYLGVCILEQNLLLARKFPELKRITVAGFPNPNFYDLIANNPRYWLALGNYNQEEKDRVIRMGEEKLIDELDVVFPFAWYAQKEKELIKDFLEELVVCVKVPVKVIIELGTLLTKEENIREVCKILEDAGVTFVKTNTGLIKQDFFSLSEYVKKLKNLTDLPIKASGGIKTPQQVEVLLQLGVKRIGTSTLI